MRLLVVVDMQNDFVSGALGFDGAADIIPGIKEKVEKYLQEDCSVLFTQDTHYEHNYAKTREGKNLPILHCVYDTEGWKIVKEFKPYLKSCGILIKEDSFGFTAWALDQTNIPDGEHDLDLEDVTEIEIVGLVTNLCVLSCAVCLQAICPNADIIVDARCCSAPNWADHENALNIMEGLQMKVINR